jgi:hypothetical protein
MDRGNDRERSPTCMRLRQTATKRRSTKIVALFAAGEPADYLHEMECYTENIREEQD